MMFTSMLLALLAMTNALPAESALPAEILNPGKEDPMLVHNKSDSNLLTVSHISETQNSIMLGFPYNIEPIVASNEKKPDLKDGNGYLNGYLSGFLSSVLEQVDAKVKEADTMVKAAEAKLQQNTQQMEAKLKQMEAKQGEIVAKAVEAKLETIARLLDQMETRVENAYHTANRAVSSAQGCLKLDRGKLVVPGEVISNSGFVLKSSALGGKDVFAVNPYGKVTTIDAVVSEKALEVLNGGTKYFHAGSSGINVKNGILAADNRFVVSDIGTVTTKEAVVSEKALEVDNGGTKYFAAGSFGVNIKRGLTVADKNFRVQYEPYIGTVEATAYNKKGVHGDLFSKIVHAG